MMTEGLKAVDDGSQEEKVDEDGEDDGDYFDEYGNIKENTSSSDIAAKVKKDKGKEVAKVVGKDDKTKEKRKPQHHQRGNPGWKDLDSISEDTDNSQSSERKSKGREYVKSAIDIQAVNKIMFPRESSLSWPEQEKFLFNEKLIREGRLGPGSGNQWTFYQNFKELVAEEQEEFAKFTRDVYSPAPPSLCNGHRKYVLDHRTARLGRPLTLPRYWDKTREVRLVGVNQEQSCAMILEQTLLELGNKPRAKIPELIRNNKQLFGHQLPQQYLQLINTIPPDPKIMPGSCNVSRVSDPRSGEQSWSAQSSVKVDHSKFYHKESCIDDPNCSLLAQHLVPDVIISASALKCLFDNHKPGLARTWEIPFIVRTFKSDVDERKVIIFGKPLTPREVTDEDLNILAHKVATKVKLFKRDWERKLKPRPTPTPATEKRQSPGEDLFGDVNVDIQDLEVFGTESIETEKPKPEVPKRTEEEVKTDRSEDKMDLDIGVDDVLLQVDGGDDSDSEEDNLVISEKADSVKVSPPRRSSRLRQKSSSSNASIQTPSRPSGTAKKVEGVPLEQEILDYEPDEEPLGKSSSIEESSSESDCEDAPIAKSLFLEKLKIATTNPDTSFNPPFESTQIDETLQHQPKAENKEGNDSNSSVSSSDDDDGGELLLQKKMLMMQSQAQQQTTMIENVHEDKDDSSSSESEDGGDLLLKKKMMMSQSLSASSAHTAAETLEEKDDKDDSSSDSDDDGEMLLKKKMMMVQSLSGASASLFRSEIPQTESKEGKTHYKEEEDVLSPKKKLRRISSGSEEDDNPVESKLKQLGRENVDLDKLKQKIITEKNLASMKERMEDKTELQATRRQTRARKRNAAKDTSKTNEKLFGSSTDESLNSPKKSPLKNVREDTRVQTRGKVSKRPSTDSDSEEKERFDKFASSDNSSQKSDFLGNLLTGQDKLLHSDQRLSYNTAPPPAQLDNSLADLSRPVLAPGLPPLDTFKPPIAGCNVTYRMWKLYDKSGGAKVLRCVVRSKVAGVTQTGAVVTPSVKIEHQPQFGAEQLTVSQASRDWIQTLIRPHSMLTRVRVAQDSKIAMIEEKTLSQVTHECRSLGVDPAKQLVNVYNIFSELSSLSAGQYLLQHSNKTGAFCNVYTAAGDKSTTGMDLHKMYNTLQPEDSLPAKVPYTPIDVDVLTPWHQVHGRVPGTFEPSGDKGRGGRGGRARGGRGGNRGGNRGGGNKKRGK